MGVCLRNSFRREEPFFLLLTSEEVAPCFGRSYKALCRLQQQRLQACLRNGSVQKHQGASLWDLWLYWDGSLGGQRVLFVCGFICVSVEGQSNDAADRPPLIFLAHCLNEAFIV